MRSSRHANRASPVPAQEIGTANVWVLRLKLKFFPFWFSEIARLALPIRKGVPFAIRNLLFSFVASSQSPANITVAMYNEIEDMND
jgi:hypothetical protein